MNVMSVSLPSEDSSLVKSCRCFSSATLSPLAEVMMSPTLSPLSDPKLPTSTDVIVNPLPLLEPKCSPNLPGFLGLPDLLALPVGLVGSLLGLLGLLGLLELRLLRCKVMVSSLPSLPVRLWWRGDCLWGGS